MPNFGYHLARAEGAIVRAAYAAALPYLPKPVVRQTAELPFEVYTYSGEASLPEQVASLRSLLRCAGRPRRLIVVSDGTHSARSLEILRAIDPCITLARAEDWVPADLPSPLHAYLTSHPTGKQLALIMSLPVNGPALYLDSDILFFDGAHALAEKLNAPGGPAAYLPDCQLSADERILRDPAERAKPVNTGFLFLRQKLDWSSAVQRLVEMEGEPRFFTNQTAAHVAMHANKAQPLDPAKFVVQVVDQFIYRDLFAVPEIVLRHYVNPVRHKFWTALWR